MTDRPALTEPATGCRRHEWVVFATMHPDDPGSPDVCRKCGTWKDSVKSSRGKSARRRGNDYERVLAQRLGGVKVGHHGGPEDVRTGMFNVQSKVGARFPGWMWDELAKLPRTDGRVPLLVVADSPGAGVRRRAVVVLGLDDWISLHGEATGDAE